MAQRHSSDWDFVPWISPTLLRVVFALICIAYIAWGIWMIAMGLRSNGQGAMVLVGLLTMVLGPLMFRLYFEAAMAVFRTDARLSELGRWLKQNQTGGEKPKGSPSDPFDGFGERI